MGLKIHVSKTHKNKCEECEHSFKKNDDFIRHKAAHGMLNTILDKKSETLGLVLRTYSVNEKCLGLFSLTNPRLDGLPRLLLHCSECWGRAGHSCSDLLPTKDYDVQHLDVVPDYDHYDPALHAQLDDLVLGGSIDWTRLKMILQEW